MARVPKVGNGTRRLQKRGETSGACYSDMVLRETRYVEKTGMFVPECDFKEDQIKEIRMSVKNEKIMVFVGSKEAKMFVDSLAEYTDHIYAVVSEEYGSRQHVLGNITVIPRYLDSENIKSWVNRVGISVLVDGTEIHAAAASDEIKKTAEEIELDYYKISSSVDIDFTHTVRCADVSDVIREASYTVGNVLMIGCDDMIEAIVTEKDGVLKDRVVALLPPEEKSIQICCDAGYPEENIICMSTPLPAVLLCGIIEGKRITHLVISAGDIMSLRENLKAAEISKIKVSLVGEIVRPKGMSADQVWDIFTARLGIEAY